MTRNDHERRVAALKRRYAHLFDGDHLGHDIAPAWLALIEDLCARIDERLTDADRAVVRFVQLKEKFGSLRAYLNVAPLRIDIVTDTGAPISGYRREQPSSDLFSRLAPFIRATEERSFRTCVFCAAPAKLRSDRAWLLTFCDRHESFTYADLKERFEKLTAP